MGRKRKKRTNFTFYDKNPMKVSSQHEFCEAEGKLCYSFKEARLIINNCKKKRSERQVKPAREYYCEYCGAYHLTSRRQNGVIHLDRYGYEVGSKDRRMKGN